MMNDALDLDTPETNEEADLLYQEICAGIGVEEEMNYKVGQKAIPQKQIS